MPRVAPRPYGVPILNRDHPLAQRLISAYDFAPWARRDFSSGSDAWIRNIDGSTELYCPSWGSWNAAPSIVTTDAGHAVRYDAGSTALILDAAAGTGSTIPAWLYALAAASSGDSTIEVICVPDAGSYGGLMQCANWRLQEFGSSLTWANGSGASDMPYSTDGRAIHFCVRQTFTSFELLNNTGFSSGVGTQTDWSGTPGFNWYLESQNGQHAFLAWRVYRGWLADGAIDRMFARPWAITHRPPAKVWLFASGGGATTHALAGSDGVAFGGTADLTRIRTLSATAGLTLGSSADATRIRTLSGTDGITVGGTADLVRVGVLAGTGGLVLASSAALTRIRTLSASDGVTFGGSAALGAIYSLLASDGVVLGGSADLTRVPGSGTVHDLAGTGGLSLSGSADVTRVATLAGTAAITFAASADVTRIRTLSGTAGLTIASTADLTRIRTLAGSGGLSLGASAALTRIVQLAGTGGIVLGGTAIFGQLPSVADAGLAVITLRVADHVELLVLDADEAEILLTAIGTSRFTS